MTKENLLVTLADKNYVEQAKQLFSSVYWNAGWKGDYMLLSHEIPEKDLKWFRDKGILIKKCKPLSKDYVGVAPHLYHPAVLDKFYLLTPEFKKWKNIIFLDADIIVRASLNALTNVNGFASSAPLGQKFLYHFYPCKEMEELKKNYNLNKCPLNSAMMFFNTNIIQNDTFEKIFSLHQRYKKIAIGDDPIFNLFFYKNWINFPPVYNVLIYSTLNYPPKRGIIFHFPGNKSAKPWNSNNIFYNEWKENLKKAELIDLTKIPEGKKWTRLDVNAYSLYLKIKTYIYLNLTYLLNLPDRLLGKLGILIKKYDPHLYVKLKKVEKKIRR